MHDIREETIGTGKSSAERRSLLLFVATTVLLCLTIGWVLVRDRRQSEQIATMAAALSQIEDESKANREALSSLSGRIENMEQMLTADIAWGGDFNYLAIGNSITLHGYSSYWWDDDRGMAASRDDADYVHLVSSYLEGVHGAVEMHAYNFAAWEVSGHDRAEFLGLLSGLLDAKIDLVTIQLGENAYDLSTYEADWEELISYVKANSPNAKIVVVGDFWTNDNRDDLKESAARAKSVAYASLDGIRDNEEYYAGVGTEVEGSDGAMHAIEREDVASHPGDEGMEAIAQRVIGCL